MRQPIDEVHISLARQERILSLGWHLEHELHCSFSYMSQGYYLVRFPPGTIEEDGLIWLPCGTILQYIHERTWVGLSSQALLQQGRQGRSMRVRDEEIGVVVEDGCLVELLVHKIVKNGYFEFLETHGCIG